MATVYEIVQALSQAAANAYDGAHDADGKPIKAGLQREEGSLLLTSVSWTASMLDFTATLCVFLTCLKFNSKKYMLTALSRWSSVWLTL